MKTVDRLIILLVLLLLVVVLLVMSCDLTCHYFLLSAISLFVSIWFGVSSLFRMIGL